MHIYHIYNTKGENNMWYKTSDGWFTFYVNIITREKKLHLEEGDIEVEAPEMDDFYLG